MKKRVILTLVWLELVWVLAISESMASERRMSSVSLAIEFWKGLNPALDASGEWGVSSKWLLFGKFQFLNNGNNQRTTLLELGGDWIVHPNLSLHASLNGRKYPEELSAGGINLGPLWVLSSLWSSGGDTEVIQTYLGFDLDFEAYNQARATRLLNQWSLSFSISQSILENLLIKFAYSKSIYNVKPSSLTRLIDNINFALPNTGSLISDLPNHQGSIQLMWDAHLYWTFVLGASRSLTVTLSERVDSLTLSSYFKRWERWELELRLGVSGVDGFQDSMVGVGGRYLFP